MAYVVQRAVSDGTLQVLSLTFPFIDITDVTVYLQPLGGVLTEAPVGTSWDWVGREAIRFVSPRQPGTLVEIRRSTSAERILHTFTAGAMFNARTMDENFSQVLYVAQEAAVDADEARTTAITAEQIAGAAELAASDAVVQAQGAVSTADAAATAAASAVSVAGAANATAGTAMSTANAANARSTAALNTANSASSTAGTALSTANAAVSTATSAMDTANSAAGVADAANLTADTAAQHAGAALLAAADAEQAAATAVRDASTALDTAISIAGTANTALSVANAADVKAQTALDSVLGGGVTSFNGRTGDVTPAAGDYTAADITGLGSAATADIGTAAGTVAAGNDSRFGSWGAATVSKGEAEAGTSTTDRKWTAQRVRQAIVAWWAGTSTVVGRALVAAADAAAARGILQLGSAATRDVTASNTDRTAGRLLQVGDAGTGSVGLEQYNFNAALDNRPSGGFIGAISAPTSPDRPYDSTFYLNQYLYDQNPNRNGCQVAFPGNANITPTLYLRTRIGGVWSQWLYALTSGNTTVDGNGNVKAASPVLRLYSDRVEPGCIGAPTAEFKRESTGVYTITGTHGLRVQDGWYIETPVDRNKVPCFNVDWVQDVEPETVGGVVVGAPTEVVLTIRCFERVWDPETGAHLNGDPVDIPDGRWIDLRFNEVAPEPEVSYV